MGTRLRGRRSRLFVLEGFLLAVIVFAVRCPLAGPSSGSLVPIEEPSAGESDRRETNETPRWPPAGDQQAWAEQQRPDRPVPTIIEADLATIDARRELGALPQVSLEGSVFEPSLPFDPSVS